MVKAFKRFFTISLLVVFGCTLSLLIVEFTVRTLNLYNFPTDDFIEPHPELGWSHVANKEGYWKIGKERIPVRINSKGLRDKEYSYEKKEGTFRILVLGDSFTQALQVRLEDTFCKILESELNKTEERCEVINGGFAGVGTDYELTFYKHEGYKYCPDLVIIAFFANDVFDNYRSKGVLNDGKATTVYEKKGLVVSIKQFLAENSCAYNYFGYTLPAQIPKFSKILMKLGLLSSQPIDEGQRADQYLVFTQNYGTEWQKAWDITMVLLLELRQEAENRGSNLGVISIPFREQVSEDLWRTKVLDPEKGELSWDVDKPDRILAEFLNDARVPFLPLLPAFRKAAGKGQLYYSEDNHWNREGHRIAAQVVYEWIVKERLVPIRNKDAGNKAKR